MGQGFNGRDGKTRRRDWLHRTHQTTRVALRKPSACGRNVTAIVQDSEGSREVPSHRRSGQKSARSRPVTSSRVMLSASVPTLVTVIV